MAASERELLFVVAGEPPAAVAVAAHAVRSVVPERDFSGNLLDLLPGGTHGANPEHHVLVLGKTQELGLRVSGELSLLKVPPSAVLPLPDVVAAPTRLSHVIAPRGVPLMFVLDLARLEDSRAGASPEMRAVETETLR